MNIKTNKLNIRPAHKNEINEFEYTIRRTWQDDYGYEVEFEWHSKGTAVGANKQGFWMVLLNGEAAGKVLRETNSGEFIADFDGALEDEDELEWNDENAELLMKNSSDFDNWVSESVGELENFTKVK